MLEPKFDGEHWWIKIPGLIVKSKNKDLLFDGLMYAIIDQGLPKDSFNPITAVVVETITRESLPNEKKLSTNTRSSRVSAALDLALSGPSRNQRKACRNPVARDPNPIAAIALANMNSHSITAKNKERL